MAVNQLFYVAIIAIILPTLALATEYTVGDDSGWTVSFDYAAWAKGKEFHVGDTLVFKYPVGKHNVFKVNGTSFKDCVIPPKNEAMTTGNDVITLAAPGNKWYICGFKNHCKDLGQKLAITVTAAPPAPAPISAAGLVKSGFQVILVAMVAIGMMVVG